MLVTVTGILLVIPDVNDGEGCPIPVIKSAAPAIGELGVIGAEVLLVNAVSVGAGFVVAVNDGLVPNVVLAGVTGILTVELPKTAIEFGLEQLTT
jgi:hypothetical protein